jgi:hypothetical protein
MLGCPRWVAQSMYTWTYVFVDGDDVCHFVKGEQRDNAFAK